MRQQFKRIRPKQQRIKFVSYDEYDNRLCVIREQFNFHRSQQYSASKTIDRLERAGLKIGFQN